MGVFSPYLINYSQETILLEMAQKEKLFCHFPHKKFTKEHFFFFDRLNEPVFTFCVSKFDSQFFPVNLDQIFVILT